MHTLEALEKAIEFVTSGKLPPQYQPTPDLVVETAVKFHTFLNTDPEPEKDREPAAQETTRNGASPADLTF